MTHNEQVSASGMRVSSGGALSAAKAASTICLLAGIWFFISPWVYQASGNANAWNCWIVGGFMILFGIVRIARPAYSTVLSWCNTVLGIWTFFSPWIYGYTANTARFINSLCVGVVVVVFSIAAARVSAKSKATP
jgi:SPW repeat